jgi:uncharacterized membrane protein YqgA involved in biofilm formation
MEQKKMSLTNFIKLNIQGILIGAGIGFIVGKFILPTYFDYSTIAQSYGVIDNLQTIGTTSLEWAKTKTIYITTIIGAVIGMFVDEYIPEGKLL